MSETLDIETDRGDEFELQLSNGSHTTGRLITNFLDKLSEYCIQRSDSETLKWFSTLESQLEKPICKFREVLDGSICIGETDYPEKQDAFTEILVLIEVASELSSLLAETDLETTWWYVPKATANDFQALMRALKLALESGATKARIRIW